MELTQIKGENIGKKISLNEGQNKIEADNLIKTNSKLAHFAEIEKNEKEKEGVLKISASDSEHHLKVNGRKIATNQAKKINLGDTISFGENHENIFAVHEKGKEIKKEDVKNHIENAGHQVSDEEFQKILKELKLEEKLVRGLFVGLLTIAIFLSGTIFYLNSQNQMVSKKIYQELFSKDKQIQELKDLVGENPQDNADCDPNLDEDCDEIEQVDLFTQIAELEEKNKKLEEKIKKSGSESQKILEEKIAKLEDKIAESEEKGTKLNFDEETKKELSKIISGIVEQINSVKPDENEENNNEEELQKITELENKIAEIQKNLSGEELNFGENGEKVGQAVKILLNKIMQLQNEIKDLKK